MHVRLKSLRQHAVFWGVLTALGCGIFFLPTTVRAEEPFADFLAGLKRRGMYDMAAAYLESLEGSDLISAEVRETLLYERAAALLEGAKSQRDIPRRLQELEQARQLLEQFVAAHPEHALVASANVEQGQIYLLRAKAALALAETPGMSTAERQGHRKQAVELFTAGQTLAGAAVKMLDQALQGFPKFIDSQDATLRDAREKTRNELMRAQLLEANLIQNSAEAYPADSAARRKALETAAAAYGTVYETYSRSGMGLYARLGQARCYQQLGELDQALSLYEQLLQQPTEPDYFRELRTAVLMQAMECWNQPEQERYSEAIQQGERWLAEARNSDQTQPNWLAIRWHLAEAYRLRSAKLPETDNQRARDERAALEHATLVSRSANDYQQPAREYVAARRKRDVQRPEPATFVEARDRGRDAIATMQTAAGKLADTTDADVQSVLQQEMDSAREEAIEYLRLALQLIDADVAIEDVNHTRYLLAFLYYQIQYNYDAAVLGEFVARNYPESSLARRCAKIALAGYLRSWSEGDETSRAFDETQMQSLAEFTAQAWPGAAEADEAWMMLADLALRQRETAAARAYLANIAEDSPRRAMADLKAGQAVWQLYLQAAALPEAERPPAEQLSEQLIEAEQLLARGVASLPAGTPKTNAVYMAELSLAQLYATTGQADKAVQLLEQTPDGPLALAAGDGPGLYGAGQPLTIELYKLALRAYVDQQNMPKAQEMMRQLERHVSVSSMDPAQLTRIYVKLGHEIQQQIEQLAAQGKRDELDRVLGGFELFLQRIVENRQGASFNSLLWVGETYAGLADALPKMPNGSLTDTAWKYQHQATTTYEQLIARATAEPGFAPSPDAVESVRLRMARSLRHASNYEGAIKTLIQILENRPMTLEAQLEAAYTYQDWAAADAQHYQHALLGSTPVKDAQNREQNLIWGWARLAQITQSNAQYRETYYEARYNIARCYYQQALAADGAAREQTLSRAARAIEVLARLDGAAMSDSKWYDKLDELLKEIQRQQGKSPQGLAPILAGVV